MTFWSTQTLVRHLPDILTPFDPAKAKHAVYRLAMGDEYYITPDIRDFDNSRYVTRKLQPGEAFCIPAGRFGVLLSREWVKMPDNVLGFISMQTRLKNLGLVNVSGFHIDPGSDGRIIFSVFNAGPWPVHIREGDNIFRLWVSDLDQPDEAPRRGVHQESIPGKMINGISGTLESLQSLSTEIDKVNRRLDAHVYSVAVLVTLGVLVGVGIALSEL